MQPRRPPPEEAEGDEGSDSEDEDEQPPAHEQDNEEDMIVEQPPQPLNPPSARLIRRLSSSRQASSSEADKSRSGADKADSPRASAQALLALQSTPRLPSPVRSVGGLNVASVHSARSGGLQAVLPPGWMETLSATYTVPYYTNKYAYSELWLRRETYRDLCASLDWSLICVGFVLSGSRARASGSAPRPWHAPRADDSTPFTKKSPVCNAKGRVAVYVRPVVRAVKRPSGKW